MQPLFADILLVDDDAGIRDAFRDVLDDEGFQVATAVDGSDALRYLQSMPPPRLIILDLMMPGMDGWHFLRLQREDPALKSIPVVVLSAQMLTEAEAATLHVALYLRKPVKMLSLMMIVESYCRPGAEDMVREAEV